MNCVHTIVSIRANIIGHSLIYNIPGKIKYTRRNIETNYENNNIMAGIDFVTEKKIDKKQPLMPYRY